MENITEHASLLVHLAAFFYVLGFLVRDELILRLLVLAGSLLYIVYYFLAPETPLWDAIITTIILVSANLWVLFKIVFERTTFALNQDELKLFVYFSELSPGQFRKLLSFSRWRVVDQKTDLCTENEVPDGLFFLFEGNARVQRGKRKFNIGAGNFIGEISFILDEAASATVTARKKARFVEWDKVELKTYMSKNQAFNNALIASLNTNLASKLSISHQ